MASLKDVVDVLRCFSPKIGALTVTEVAQRLSWPKSNVSRLLKSMMEVGLLDKAAEGRGYSPGIMLLGLGQVAAAGMTWGVRADSAIAQLSASTGHSGFVSAREGTAMVGLTQHMGSNVLQVGLSLGTRLPVDACATGRSLLALMADEEVRELLRNQVSKVSPQSPASIDDLLARLKVVREKGYAESHDEAGKGVGAIAVALPNATGPDPISICLTFPWATVDAHERSQLIEQLLQTKASLYRGIE
ncbi:MAG: IclR family transcriptional regulator [Pseudomonadota bacterium]|jgi:DNA-binding IclR family transcriptional regulator